MQHVILGVAGLLAAGFAFEWLRQRTPVFAPGPAPASKPGMAPAPQSGGNARSRGNVVAVVLAALAGFPFATLALAWLLGSDKLGWVAALSLLAVVGLFACTGIFCIGMAIGPRSARAEAAAAAVMAGPTRTIEVDRGSVHASDESVPRQFAVSPALTVRALLEAVLADGYLPSISGARATWVVEAMSADGTVVPVAVCAQQWMEPAFLCPPHAAVESLFGHGANGRLYLRYRCQEDPGAVFQALFALGAGH